MITEGVLIKYYDKFFFNNIIVMAPSVKEADVSEGVKVQDLIDFL